MTISGPNTASRLVDGLPGMAGDRSPIWRNTRGARHQRATAPHGICPVQFCGGNPPTPSGRRAGGAVLEIQRQLAGAGAAGCTGGVARSKTQTAWAAAACQLSSDNSIQPRDGQTTEMQSRPIRLGPAARMSRSGRKSGRAAISPRSISAYTESAYRPGRFGSEQATPPTCPLGFKRAGEELVFRKNLGR